MGRHRGQNERIPWNRQCTAPDFCRLGSSLKGVRIKELIEQFLRRGLCQAKRELFLYMLADGRGEFLQNLVVDFLLRGQPTPIATGALDKPFDVSSYLA